MARLELPPLSVYVHLPWCVRKCPYCDFNSYAIEGDVPERRYVAALLRDLESQAPSVGGREVRSVFFGGGTPSLFSADAIGHIFAGIRATLAVASGVEVTLEANPGTVERGRFSEYRSAGVNRVSLGGQSFSPDRLRSLGRIHSADDTRSAAAELHAAGMANFNIDLMYGLPGQSLIESLGDVAAAVALEPAHLSHYQLTLEPGTAFYHRPPTLPDDDATWEMQVGCQEALARQGFRQYEVSAYARPGWTCVHNLNYWQFGDYLGLGAGAHGKLTDPSTGVSRTERTRQPRQYLESLERRATPPAARLIPAPDLPFEYMLNALRLVEGFDGQQFERRTGLAIPAVRAAIESAEARGLLEMHSSRGWRATPLGRRFLNDLIGLFLPPYSTQNASRRPVQAANVL
jgi:oxygen-independent coproporphyrinogen-3 oxidase